MRLDQVDQRTECTLTEHNMTGKGQEHEGKQNAL